jgi:ribosome-associated protein
LRAISTFTDFFVICSATSEPQLKAVANEIETRLREDHSIRPVAIDGFPASQWIVLDYLQVVVHVFHRDKRAFYSLEDLWGDAPSLQWEKAVARWGKGARPRRALTLFRQHCGKCRFDYFGDVFGDGDGKGFDGGDACGTVFPSGDACGTVFPGKAAAGDVAGVAGGLTSSNSTSKIKVELGEISGPAARSP